MRTQGGSVLTYLRPDHLRKSADELWRGVTVALQALLVDHLAHGEPER
jgi:hypothetical protein